MADDSASGARRPRWLPRIGSPAYHLMLATVAMFILGPLGGISSAFMNFSIGFFVGGQVLAGILGSAVTLPYGPEGKHGANYMQTMAASVAGMCAMAVLGQSIVWMGLPEPPWWKLVLFMMSVGMFGVGVGMLYTPVLVDRMQLVYPSGFAVANILRALTDRQLLKRSILKLGGGMLLGYLGGLASLNIARVGSWGLSTSTFGAGMIVGARIAIPALVVALIGLWQTPYLVRIGWLGPNESYRKIGFIISLGTILGAAVLDVGLILFQAVAQFRKQRSQPVVPAEDWKRVNSVALVGWVVFWGVATVLIGHQVLDQPVFFLTIAVLLCLLFVLVNGISLGISDWNPISSAFVMSVFIFSALGLRDPGIGLLCASILLIACSVGGDMQQDRSTGWRLGTHRVVQFRYQVLGIVVGAVLAVVLAKLFMSAYPVLRVDQFAQPDVEGSQKWQSAMTFKMVGALRGITDLKPHIMKALGLGILLGLLIEIARKAIKGNRRYQQAVRDSRAAKGADFLVDAVLLPSPYASAFGGFVELPTVLWWTAGGLSGSGLAVLERKWSSRERRGAEAEVDVPADMSTTSLIGGGLIAGDALSAVSVGIYGLLKTLLRSK